MGRNVGNHRCLSNWYPEESSFNIQCLLGMNVIPSLGIRVKRANGEVMIEPTAPEPSAEAKVYLIQSTRIQARKSTVLEAKFDLPVVRATDSLLFELDQEFLTSIGMVSEDVLPPSTNEGKVLVPLENHLLVAVDLESGTCVGNVTIVTKGESVEELAEARTFVKEKSKEPQLVGKINQVTSSDRADQVLEFLALQQGALTSEQL